MTSKLTDLQTQEAHLIAALDIVRKQIKAEQKVSKPTLKPKANIAAAIAYTEARRLKKLKQCVVKQ